MKLVSTPPAASRPKEESGPLRLEGFLPYRLNVLAETVSLALSRLYADRHGISVPEWRIVATLGQYQRMTAAEIGRHSRMHKTKVSRAVATLEDKRLVARETNPADMREAFLELTVEGRALYDGLVPLARGYVSDLTRELSPDERDSLDSLLTKLTDKAGALAGHGAP